MSFIFRMCAPHTYIAFVIFSGQGFADIAKLLMSAKADVTIALEGQGAATHLWSSFIFPVSRDIFSMDKWTVNNDRVKTRKNHVSIKMHPIKMKHVSTWYFFDPLCSRNTNNLRSNSNYNLNAARLIKISFLQPGTRFRCISVVTSLQFGKHHSVDWKLLSEVRIPFNIASPSVDVSSFSGEWPNNSSPCADSLQQPIHAACEVGTAAVVEQLLDCRAAVDSVTAVRWTHSFEINTPFSLSQNTDK